MVNKNCASFFHSTIFLLKSIYLLEHLVGHVANATIQTCPVQRPTTRSAMNVSSVSPDLWDTITPQPLSWDILQAWIDSVTEPIWFTYKTYTFLFDRKVLGFEFVNRKQFLALIASLVHLHLSGYLHFFPREIPWFSPDFSRIFYLFPDTFEE